jgi:hypothetical protein
MSGMYIDFMPLSGPILPESVVQATLLEQASIMFVIPSLSNTVFLMPISGRTVYPQSI